MSLIDNLQNATLYDHPVTEFELIETHISWVLLTGPFVYKIKKPVDFGFLNFSTLEKRHFYCKEELRLNRRLAADIYTEVVSIHGTEEHPEFNGDRPVIEYAVKMKQFPQSAQLDRLLEEQGLDNTVMEKLAVKVAEFHMSIETVPIESEFGDLEHVQQPVLENFEQIHASINDIAVTPRLNQLENWSKHQLEELAEVIRQRKAQSFVRECHGDMHLRNIALWNEQVIIFDCIEFNKNLYSIDVTSDLAFLVMDLESRQKVALAQYFLNRYLEITGDYEGLQLLNFYKVYRAMVRAKVSALRTKQEEPGSPDYNETFKEFLQYLTLAEHYINPSAPCLMINHGLSGSGKSFTTNLILEKYPAIKIRSDVERKRLFEIDASVDSTAKIEQGIYNKKATQKTYARLLYLAKCLLSAGFSVIIDAANLKYEQRIDFIELAKLIHVPYFILDFQASVETLTQRVKERAQQGNDISDATLDVLRNQLDNNEQLSDDEKPFAIVIDTENDIDVDKIVERIHASNIKF